MESPAFRVVRDGHVAELTLCGPGRGNALGPDLWRDLPVALAELDADPDVRAIVVTGDGEHFTYGLDLMAISGELMPLVAPGAGATQRVALLGLIERMQASSSAMETCATPVVAAVQGWCIGGGVDLICAADIRLASADARFSVREVKLAIVADLGTLQRLPRIVGEGAARELALTGRDIDAEHALRIGLVNSIHPDAASVRDAALEMAREIAANPPLTVQGAKRVMNWSRDHSVADGMAYVATWNAAFLGSEDLLEAMAAFAQRRAPEFKGR